MPFWIPVPLLALWLPFQGASAPPQRDPVELALELLRHERLSANENQAVSAITTAVWRSIRGSAAPPPPPSGLRDGYRLRLDARPFTAVPEGSGYTGIHGFCSAASNHICYTEEGVSPSVAGGGCSPSCRDLPDDLSTLLPAPQLSAQERDALITEIDSDRLLPGQPAVRELVRSLLDRLSRPRTGRSPAHSVSALAFTPDGSALIAADMQADRAVLWSVASRKPLGMLAGCDGLFDLAVTPDGATALTTCWTEVKLWSLPDFKPRGALGPFDMGLTDLALDGSGKTLAAISGAHAALWQLPGGRVLGSIETAPPATVVAGARVAVTPDGTALVTGGRWQPTTMWSIPQGKLLARLEGGASNTLSVLAISGDGSTLATGYGDGHVALWALSDRRVLTRPLEHGRGVNSLAFSADGRTLVSGASDNSVKVWSVPEATVRRTLRGHGTEVFAVAVSSTGLIASGDRDGVVRLWDLATGAPKGELVPPALPEDAATRRPSPRPRP